MASYVFPTNLVSYTYWMTLNFYAYQMPFGGGIGNNAPLLTAIDTVRLPIPNQLLEHSDIVYAVEELGLTAGAALSKFQETGSVAQAAESAAGNGLLQGAVNVGNRILPGGTAGGANILLQTQGVAVNPFLSVMFKTPAFRKMAFKWKLSPVNEQESITMNAIATTIKRNQLPGAVNGFGGALLSYPNIVLISVSATQDVSVPLSASSYWTMSFKPAVIESFAVNWTPNGQAAIFGTTSAPVESEFTMSLLEIEYFLSNNFAGASNLSPGTNINGLLNAINNLSTSVANVANTAATLPIINPPL